MVSTRHVDHVLRETFRKIKADMLRLQQDITQLRTIDLQLSQQLLSLQKDVEKLMKKKK